MSQDERSIDEQMKSIVEHRATLKFKPGEFDPILGRKIGRRGSAWGTVLVVVAVLSALATAIGVLLPRLR